MAKVPERDEPSALRTVARFGLLTGGFVAIWLLLPTVARASDDPVAVAEGTTDAIQVVDVPQTAEEVLGPGATAVETLVPDVGPTIAGVQTLLSATTSAVDDLGATIEGLTITLPELDGVVEKVAPLPLPVGDTLDPTDPVIDPTDPVIDPTDPRIEPTDPRIVGKVPGPIGGGEQPSPFDARSTGPNGPDELVVHVAAPWQPVISEAEPGSASSPSSGSSAAVPAGLEASAGGVGRSGARVSPDDFAAYLILTILLLCLGRWSRHEAEFRIAPVFLSLAERPG